MKVVRKTGFKTNGQQKIVGHTERGVTLREPPVAEENGNLDIPEEGRRRPHREKD